jgi:hypothetical protein
MLYTRLFDLHPWPQRALFLPYYASMLVTSNNSELAEEVSQHALTCMCMCMPVNLVCLYRFSARRHAHVCCLMHLCVFRQSIGTNLFCGFYFDGICGRLHALHSNLQNNWGSALVSKRLSSSKPALKIGESHLRS